VHAHHAQDVQLLPLTASYHSQDYGNPVGSLINFQRYFPPNDIVVREVKMGYYLTLEVTDEWKWFPGYKSTDNNLASVPVTAALGSFIGPVPDGINQLITNSQSFIQGQQLVGNRPAEHWLYRQAGQSPEQMEHATAYNGRDDPTWADQSFTSQFHLSSLVRAEMEPDDQDFLPQQAHPSSKLIASDKNTATFYCEDFLYDGIFLPEGEAESVAGLSQLTDFELKLTFGTNVHSLWRPLVPLRGYGSLTEHMTVTISNFCISMRSFGMDPMQTTTNQIAYRPIEIIRSHVTELAPEIPEYDPLDYRTYPRNMTTYQATFNNLPASYVPEKMVLAVVPKDRNQTCYNVSGSPFSLTKLAITTSNSVGEQLRELNTAELVGITQRNGGWIPKTHKWTIGTIVTDIDKANLPPPSKSVMNLPGNMVVLAPGDYSTAEIVAPGQMVTYNLNLSLRVDMLMELKRNVPQLPELELPLSKDPADYQVILLMSIPSVLASENGNLKTQLGRFVSPTLAKLRSEQALDPTMAVAQLATFGTVARASASHGAAAGGSIRSLMKTARNWVRHNYEKAKSDPIGFANRTFGHYQRGKRLWDDANSFLGDVRNDMRPPNAKRPRPM
jgi:hypothetical protein